jgi:hypothetical protein
VAVSDTEREMYQEMSTEALKERVTSYGAACRMAGEQHYTAARVAGHESIDAMLSELQERADSQG